tara:strand:+ start:95 stop:583 length:489 start_codon:yes stop_codon:yes gene_type:complete
MTYSAKKHIKNMVHKVDYAFTPQSISTTVTAYNGTEINYTPANSSNSVIIEINAPFGFMPDSKIIANTRLQESIDNGASWSDLDGFKAFEGNDEGEYNSFTSAYFFTLPPYSGQKKFRLAGRSKDTNTEYSFGHAWNMSTGGAPNFGAIDTPAHISIYEVET